MKSVKRYFFVLGLMFALAGHAFATPQTVEGSPAEASSKSLYWGPRLSVLLSNAWNNKRVKGVFDSYSNEVWENSVLRTGFGMEFGVCAWYMLNDYFGLAAEADMRFVEHRLNKQVYSRQEWNGYGSYDIEEYYLYVYSASFPLLMRLRPVRYMYLEAGAQIVFNFDGEITDKDGDPCKAMEYSVWSVLLFLADEWIAVEIFLYSLQKGASYEENLYDACCGRVCRFSFCL